MSTKKINITDPKDFQAGDLFTGTAVSEPTPGVKVRVSVKDQPLKTGSSHDGRLYVGTYMSAPYVDRTEASKDPYSNGYWESGYATREVEVKEHLRFQPGSIVKHRGGGVYVLTPDESWVALNSNRDSYWVHIGTRFEVHEKVIRDTIENVASFAKSYTLLVGPEPEEVD